MRSIVRKEQLVTLTFGDEADGDGKERTRVFLLREQSTRKQGLFLARLDAVVQSVNGCPGGKQLPTAEHEAYLFSQAATAMDPVIFGLLTRPQDNLPALAYEEMAELSEGQKQELIAVQCELNGFGEELMGKLKSLQIQIHAIRLAAVMVDHLEAVSKSSQPESSTGYVEPATETSTE